MFQTKFTLSGDVGDWAVGNALVLLQIDWPQNAEILSAITERIVNTAAFRYPLFQTYVIAIDILEELTYLWTEHGGGVSLEIALSSEVLQSKRINVSIKNSTETVSRPINRVNGQEKSKESSCHVFFFLQK